MVFLLLVIVIGRDVEERLFWSGRSREGVEGRKSTWARLVGGCDWGAGGDVGHSEGETEMAEERREIEPSYHISPALSGPRRTSRGQSRGHP